MTDYELETSIRLTEICNALAESLGITKNGDSTNRLIEMVPEAIRKARQQGRDEARVAVLGVLARIPHDGARVISVELENAVRGLEKL